MYSKPIDIIASRGCLRILAEIYGPYTGGFHIRLAGLETRARFGRDAQGDEESGNQGRA